MGVDSYIAAGELLVDCSEVAPVVRNWDVFTKPLVQGLYSRCRTPADDIGSEKKNGSSQ